MFHSLPVLMYHSISRFNHRLCVSPELFDEHCKALTQRGWRGISLPEAEEYFLRKKRLPRKTLLLTFDDGYLDNYINAEPILEKYGHSGTLFTVVGLIDNRDIDRRLLGESEGGIKENSFLLDKRDPVRRRSWQVSPIVYCSWKELSSLQSAGTMNLAPHSMYHNRVIGSLNFKALYTPGGVHTFFDIPPYEAVWGMPHFPLTHGLTNRSYRLAPELFDLVKKMVPQEEKEAQSFLSNKKNYQSVVNAIRKLPRLGTIETEKEYRDRIAKDFMDCRSLYEEKLGITPRSFCWPWGSFSSIALEEAKKAGFTIFFTTLFGGNTFGNAEEVYRISVRGGSGEDLLKRVRLVSLPFFSLGYKAYCYCDAIVKKIFHSQSK